MNDKIIDGAKLSDIILSELKNEVEYLKNEKGLQPGLAFILVGKNPASEVYVRNKKKACEKLGIFSLTETFPEDISESELLNAISKFNNDNKIHGILVQLPLPPKINEYKILSAIDYKKDVDGFHPYNIGNLMLGLEGFIPCTPYGIVELLVRYKIETKGKNVVIIGRSNIVGKPLAALLIQKKYNCTVTLCHSATVNLSSFTSNADILVAAIGKPHFIKSDYIKEGSIIIDVGINRVEDPGSKNGYKIVGDVDFQECLQKCSMITPVPGGVGKMTIAMLMKNTIKAAKNSI
jgi:methylenetetrahydrofolate dehydrogenase (NADP+)/methenyltetrahydrofolate cyclohydrolase